MTSIIETTPIETTPIEHLDEECPVCLEVPLTTANNGDGFKTLSNCGHKVCCRCVKSIVFTNYNAEGLRCPLCRAVDPTFIDVRVRISRERRIAASRMRRSVILNVAQPPDRQIDYERILHQSAARTMNRTRVINGPLAPRSAIPQQVPVFCLRCETPGCQTKNRTKRRCPNHSQVPCCTKCYECNECIRI
jgi:hypothetical protein